MQEIIPIAERVARLLVARQERIAVAESSSGGLISAALLAVPGASAYFVAGGVAYTATARERLFDIGPDRMAGMRSSSPPYAMLLARTVRDRFGTHWALAETGAAGPAGNRYGDPPGHSCLAISGLAEHALTLQTGQANRLVNMRAFAMAALELMEDALETQPAAA